MRYPASDVSAEPSLFCVGGIHDSVAAPDDDCAFTAIANAGSDAFVRPSLTLMTTFEYVPTFEVVGVPDSCPVVVLKVAQLGRFAIENVSASPSASVAVGRKLYAAFALTVPDAVPLIVGARLPAPTLIANAGSEVVALPSLALMTIEECVPAADGVPLKRPVAVLKDAQLGLF